MSQMIKSILNTIIACFILVGVINIIGSILVLFDIPFFTRWNDWSKHSSEESFSIIKEGIILIFISIIYWKYIEPKIPEKTKNKKTQYAKCPNCKEVFNYNELINGKCKNCKDVDTIDLDEYFEKYPEELEEKD